MKTEIPLNLTDEQRWSLIHAFKVFVYQVIAIVVPAIITWATANPKYGFLVVPLSVLFAYFQKYTSLKNEDETKGSKR